MGLFGGCGVNEASVAACSKQMHTQLIQRQHVLKVVHQLKKVTSQFSSNNAVPLLHVAHHRCMLQCTTLDPPCPTMLYLL